MWQSKVDGCGKFGYMFRAELPMLGAGQRLTIELLRWADRWNLPGFVDVVEDGL